MKVNLPEKDLTKYKTTEAHLDWGKVAFNTYSAEMCKQKWLEVSREVRILTKGPFAINSKVRQTFLGYRVTYANKKWQN